MLQHSSLHFKLASGGSTNLRYHFMTIDINMVAWFYWKKRGVSYRYSLFNIQYIISSWTVIVKERDAISPREGFGRPRVVSSLTLNDCSHFHVLFLINHMGNMTFYSFVTFNLITSPGTNAPDTKVA